LSELCGREQVLEELLRRASQASASATWTTAFCGAPRPRNSVRASRGRNSTRGRPVLVAKGERSGRPFLSVSSFPNRCVAACRCWSDCAIFGSTKFTRQAGLTSPWKPAPPPARNDVFALGSWLSRRHRDTEGDSSIGTAKSHTDTLALDTRIGPTTSIGL
jgi:hypothetical protein